MFPGRLRVRLPFHKRAIPAWLRAVARRPVFRACNRATTLLRNQRAATTIAHGFRHETVRRCRVLFRYRPTVGGRWPLPFERPPRLRPSRQSARGGPCVNS